MRMGDVGEVKNGNRDEEREINKKGDLGEIRIEVRDEGRDKHEAGGGNEDREGKGGAERMRMG